MTLRDRISIEPLGEERLAQLERRVVAGAAATAASGHRSARRLGWRVAAAAVVTAGLLGWIARGGPAAAPGGEPAPIVVSTARAHAVLDIGDAQIESGPEAAFTLTRPSGGVMVAMTRGKLELAVGKRGDRPPLVVRAGATDVIVVGTRFTVDYGDGTDEVEVRVLEGVVRVVHREQEARVAAGQAWQTRRGVVAIRELESATTADNARAASALATAGGAATPRVPPGNASAAPPRATAGNASAPPPRAIAGDASAPRPRATDPRIDLRTAIRAQPVDAALPLGGIDPAAAVAKYYDIAAHTSGDQASQAFYSIAVVRHASQGRDADALQTLDAYVRRFPGGKEYRAALWLRVRILCLARLDDRCRAAAYTYLHEAPDGPAARIAEQITVAE